MKPILPALLVLLTLNTSGLAELLDNGDFAQGIKHWFVNRSPDYGAETGAKIADGALHLSDLTGPNPVYLNLVQPIDIMEGTTYRLTFEVMAPPGTTFTCSIGDHRAGMVTGKKTTVAGSEWESASYDLTAKINTNSKWFKSEKKTTAKSKLKEGRTFRKKATKRPDNPGVCVLAFGLGGVENRIALRNISLTEVTSEPSSE